MRNEQEEAGSAPEADRLLDGENPETRELEDAEHWLGAYAELLGFKQRLIREAETGSEELSASPQEEVERDLSFLEGEKQRLTRRYLFWRDRVDELKRA